MKTFNYSSRKTSQTAPIPGREDMVKNNAGGFVFEVDKWKFLERFLIIGTETGTYYVNKNTLDKQNAENVLACIKEDGLRTVNRIVEISDAGRSPSNDPCLFALAMASAFGDARTRKAAFSALPQVARIPTHLFHFCQYREQFAGWGRGMRRAIANWYRTNKNLEYHMLKYRQRDGWSHRDLLRLAHPKPINSKQEQLFTWATNKPVIEPSGQLEGFLKAQQSKNALEVAKLVQEYSLTREMIPTQFLNSPEVWEALLPNMPITALIRNLSTLTRLGVITPFNCNEIAVRISDSAQQKTGRVHPLQMMVALLTYSKGKGQGSTWNPVEKIVDALNEGFYASFSNVRPTNKNVLIALDVSSSMTWSYIQSMSGITCAQASAAMCMVTARTEPNHHIMGFSDKFKSLDITANMDLTTVTKRVYDVSFGRTDCALPMRHALKNKWPVDVFIVYTDNETWAGPVHPAQALQEFRQKVNPDAKLVVVGMTATKFTIADPKDFGMLDVVGFDTATPEFISSFARGELIQ